MEFLIQPGAPTGQNVPDSQPVLIMDQLSAAHIGQAQPDGSRIDYTPAVINNAQFMEYLVKNKTKGH
jgi:hypothetical protein